MEKQPFSKRIPFILSQLVLILVIAVLAGYTGYRIAVRPFKLLAEHYDKFRTVGSLLKNRDISPGLSDLQRTEFYKIYSQEEKIIPRVDQIIWMVPNMLTPFVVVGPTPGTHDNAQINRMQFRSGEELVIPKPSGEYRIFITGGSTAFGSGAPDQEHTIGALLEKNLNESRDTETRVVFKVYTLANPTWASTHERIIIENRLSELEPDLVISLSGVNDVHWGGGGRDIFWFRTYIDDYFSLVIDHARELAGKTKDPDIIPISSRPVHPVIVAQRMLKNVRLSTYALSLKNIPYVFFLQPTLAVCKKALTPREKGFFQNEAYFTLCFDNIRRELAQIREANFYFADLSACLDGIGKPENPEDIFLDSFHFGDKGNQIVATEMGRYIRRILEGKEI